METGRAHGVELSRCRGQHASVEFDTDLPLTFEDAGAIPSRPLGLPLCPIATGQSQPLIPVAGDRHVGDGVGGHLPRRRLLVLPGAPHRQSMKKSRFSKRRDRDHRALWRAARATGRDLPVGRRKVARGRHPPSSPTNRRRCTATDSPRRVRRPDRPAAHRLTAAPNPQVAKHRRGALGLEGDVALRGVMSCPPDTAFPFTSSVMRPRSAVIR